MNVQQNVKINVKFTVEIATVLKSLNILVFLKYSHPQSNHI